MSQEPRLLSLSEQAEMFRDGEFTAVELVQSHLDEINRLNPKLHSFITVDEEDAIRQARAIDGARANNLNLGPLAGIAIGVKDSIPTKNLRTTDNSRLLEAWVPDEDASVLSRLRKAGAIIIGKTNLNEFGWSRPSEADMHPPPWNPWNPERMSVGSSSGSGAASAARMSAATIGTDGGGSARLPAGAHNLYGIKPTHGLVSRLGMDHNGHSEISPLCRTALDTALMLGCMAGYEPDDDMSWPGKIPDYANNLDIDITGWRIGVPRAFIDSAPNESEVTDAFDNFLDTLRMLGCKLVDIELKGMAEARAANFLVLNSEAYQRHQKSLRESWYDYGPITRVYLLQGAFLSAGDMLNASEVGRAFRNYFSRLIADQKLKAIALPTSPFATAERSRRPSEHSRGINACYTAPFNIAGHPSISIPAGFGEAGIPVGVMLTGELHDDLSLLQIAHIYDKATDWSSIAPTT
jgi:aspartyl-tRNA(Asn)/glutamyl-tRNA(Gln) amidotransferase subunit A